MNEGVRFFHLRLTVKQYAFIEEQARLHGLDKSSYVRMLITTAKPLKPKK